MRYTYLFLNILFFTIFLGYSMNAQNDNVPGGKQFSGPDNTFDASSIGEGLMASLSATNEHYKSGQAIVLTEKRVTMEVQAEQENMDTDLTAAVENESIEVDINTDNNYIVIEDKKYTEGNEIYIYDADDQIIYQNILTNARTFFTPTDESLLHSNYVIFISGKNGNYFKNIRFE